MNFSLTLCNIIVKKFEFMKIWDLFISKRESPTQLKNARGN